MRKSARQALAVCIAVSIVSLTAACGGQTAPDNAGTANEPAAPGEAVPPAPDADLLSGDPRDDGPGFPRSFRALGTEPFWAIHVSEGRLRYMTPENQEGIAAEVTWEQTAQDRMALAATVDGKALTLRGRIEPCSDGMSDRIYPYSVTLTLGEETRQGCARPIEP